MLNCQCQGILIAGRQQLRVAPSRPPLDGANRMDHVTRLQLAAARDDGLPCGQTPRITSAPYLPAFLQYLRPTRIMNRAVNASPAEQGRISCIDYGVNALVRYVAYNDGDSPAQERFKRLRAIHRLNYVQFREFRETSAKSEQPRLVQLTAAGRRRYAEERPVLIVLRVPAAPCGGWTLCTNVMCSDLELS